MSEASELEKKISALGARVAKEGKTDEIENELDELEKSIGAFKKMDATKADQLKEMLGEIK